MLPKHVKIVSIGKVTPDPTWGVKKHRHVFNELIVIFGGKMSVAMAGREIHAGKGDVLFYPQGIFHEEHSDPQDPVETIYIAWYGKVVGPDLRVHDIDGRIRMVIRWLFEEKHSSDECRTIVNNPFLLAILAEYFKLDKYKGQPDSGPVRDVRRYILDHLAEPHTLEILADQAGMSKFHFVRTYKKLTGRTPMDDLRLIRVEAARDLVITTNLPLKSIAPRVGFCNEYHLCRTFRQYLKVPPGHFRSR